MLDFTYILYPLTDEPAEKIDIDTLMGVSIYHIVNSMPFEKYSDEAFYISSPRKCVCFIDELLISGEVKSKVVIDKVENHYRILHDFSHKDSVDYLWEVTPEGFKLID